MPWGTLRLAGRPPEQLAAARQVWTRAAFQEHRTGAACARALEALIAARAPLDLIAVATRFPLDEMAHVELCARLCAELGGGIPLLHDPLRLVPEPAAGLTALGRAAELVIRIFCVGEAVSIPLLRASGEAASEPLVQAVLRRIVKDEAAHGRFGYWFLDWALAPLAAEADWPRTRATLTAAAQDEIDKLRASWDEVMRSMPPQAGGLGWLDHDRYLDLAHGALAAEVIAPLNARGFAVR